MLDKGERFYAVLFGALFLLAFLLLGAIDFQMAESMYDFGRFAHLVSNYGWLPAFAIAWLEALLIVSYALHNRVFTARKLTLWIYFVFGLLAAAGLSLFVFAQLLSRFHIAADYRVWVMGVSTSVLAVLGGVRIITERDIYDERRSAERAMTGLLVFLVIWGVTMLLNLWTKRLSYSELLQPELPGDELGGYTTWHQKGFAEADGCFPSFPAAMGFATVSVYYLFRGSNRSVRNLILVLCALYGLFVGWMSVRCGYAYPTDVLFAGLLAFAVLFCGGLELHMLFPKAGGELLKVQTSIED